MSTDRSTGLDVGTRDRHPTVVFGHPQTLVVSTSACDIGARFAVPFFFLVSGFFLKRPDLPLAVALTRLDRRLLLPFALWLAIDLTWFQPPPSAFPDPRLPRQADRPRRAGPSSLVPALARRLARALPRPPRSGRRAAYHPHRCRRLYALALLFGAYHDALTGGGRFVWNMRNGPFFAFPFIAAGW